jgi:predicted HAD superfamily phosphohydrolase
MTWYASIGSYPMSTANFALISPRKVNPADILMTHKYRGCIVVLSINKSVEPNKEQKVLTSGFDQGFTVNTSKRVFRGIW